MITTTPPAGNPLHGNGPPPQRIVPRQWVRCVLGCLALLAPATAAAQAPVMPVSVAMPVQREVRAGRTVVGTVLPRRSSLIGGTAEERVVEFPVNEGDRVERGQVLARLDTGTLEIQLAAARAELELRKEELAELENGSRPEEIEQAKARALGAEAMMNYARSVLERTRRLVQEASAAEDEIKKAIADAEQAEQAYREAQAAEALVVAGPRKERIAQARARVHIQEQEIARLQDDIRKHTIIAPFDGYIIAEHTEVGEWLALGGPVVEIAELDEVEVEVMVLEDAIGFLRVGQQARVEIGALPGQAFVGDIVKIIAQADTRSRSFPVKVRLANKRVDESDVLLKGGMFARVTLPAGSSAKAVLVPKDALVLGGPEPVVYVVDPDPSDPSQGKARAVPVELGIAAEARIEVKGDLRADQPVVVLGNERLRPGQDVMIIESARVRPADPVAEAPTTYAAD